MSAAADPSTDGPDESPRRSSGRRWRRPALVATLLVVGSLLPAGGADPPVPVPLGLVGADKWLHAVGYAAFAGVLVPAPGTDRATRRTVVRAVVVATALGAALELCQGAVPGRTCSLADVAANALGAVAGAGAAAVAARRSGG